MKSRHPLIRLFHKVRANLFGYFWFSCDVCGTYSGGHEWAGEGFVVEAYEQPEDREIHVYADGGVFIRPSRIVKSRGVCPWCAPAVRRIEARGEEPTFDAVCCEVFGA